MTLAPASPARCANCGKLVRISYTSLLLLLPFAFIIVIEGALSWWLHLTLAAILIFIFALIYLNLIPLVKK
jgi:membrane protein YdbS with pleckstrin-like domain